MDWRNLQGVNCQAAVTFDLLRGNYRLPPRQFDSPRFSGAGVRKYLPGNHAPGSRLEPKQMPMLSAPYARSSVFGTTGCVWYPGDEARCGRSCERP
jgi:hypothetical protein